MGTYTAAILATVTELAEYDIHEAFTSVSGEGVQAQEKGNDQRQ